MKRMLCFATLAIGPSLVFAQTTQNQSDSKDTVNSPQANAAAPEEPVGSRTIQNQSDINDTVYLQQANAGMALGNAIGNPVGGSPPAFGSPLYMQEMQAFNQYQQSMGMVVAAHDDIVRKQKDYEHLLEEADFAAKTKDVDERRHYFGNYLVDSRNFLRDHPDAPPRLWVLRAIAAVQLNKEATGKEAGHMILTALPEKDRSDPHIQKLLVILHGMGWLPDAKGGAAPAATPAGATK